LVDFLRNFTKDQKITQKKLFESFLKNLKKEQLRKKIITESKRLFEDKELQKECIWLANSWLEDYNNNLKKIENGEY